MKKAKKTSLLLVVSCVFFCFVSFVHTQERGETVRNDVEQKDSVRVLFIGNSYTYYNDMPEIVKAIALTQEINIAYTAIAPGGARFVQHLKNKAVLQAIRKGNWDFVILQEQSSAPAFPSKQVVQNVYPAAGSLNSLVHTHNKEAKVIFYMTWGHQDGMQGAPADYPLVETYEGMQERLKISYLEMAYQHKAWCAPVGMAWQCVRKERPDYILYTSDGSHPSPLGSYLAANVIFTTIYQQPYQTAFVNGLPQEQAEYIQQIAQKTVFQNLKLLNIK